MIKNMEPVSMPEVMEYIKKDEIKETDLKGFIKNFVVISASDAKAMTKKLKDFDLMKIGDEQIVKIIELLPENSDDLNKILMDVKLDEDETKKILDTIKEYK